MKKKRCAIIHGTSAELIASLQLPPASCKPALTPRRFQPALRTTTFPSRDTSTNIGNAKTAPRFTWNVLPSSFSTHNRKNAKLQFFHQTWWNVFHNSWCNTLSSWANSGRWWDQCRSSRDNHNFQECCLNVRDSSPCKRHHNCPTVSDHKILQTSSFPAGCQFQSHTSPSRKLSPHQISLPDRKKPMTRPLNSTSRTGRWTRVVHRTTNHWSPLISATKLTAESSTNASTDAPSWWHAQRPRNGRMICNDAIITSLLTATRLNSWRKRFSTNCTLAVTEPLAVIKKLFSIFWLYL